MSDRTCIKPGRPDFKGGYTPPRIGLATLLSLMLLAKTVHPFSSVDISFSTFPDTTRNNPLFLLDQNKIQNGKARSTSKSRKKMVLKEPTTASTTDTSDVLKELQSSKSSNNEEKSLSSKASKKVSKRSQKSDSNNDKLHRKQATRNAARQKYKRKRIPDTEREVKNLRQQRQAAYDRLVQNTKGGPVSIWSFEGLFPEPVWDEETIRRDLYEIKERDKRKAEERSRKQNASSAAASKAMNLPHAKMKNSFYGGSAMMRIWREPRSHSGSPSFAMTSLLDDQDNIRGDPTNAIPPPPSPTKINEQKTPSQNEQNSKSPIEEKKMTELVNIDANMTIEAIKNTTGSQKVDIALTRMVEDRIYGFRRTQTGEFRYDTSLMGDGAVKFRDGVRLGNPLKVNADRLNYLAKKEMQHGRVEEAVELYEQAIEIDPKDGRAYLGLSRCAQRRRDFKLAKRWLQAGVQNSVSMDGDIPDRGPNPFLLQALGHLEERMGNLAEAEKLYISAAKSRPSHAAAWVSLAQIRTRKLGQPAMAGRVCFQTAERELNQAGARPSSYVYTAWASLEYKKAGDVKRARELFKKAIEVDPRCSAAWLQLGVMEADAERWDEAQACFDTVLKFDQRNSRVMQAYALSETRRPDGNSRKAIDLFERALKINPRDAGVLQAYALYVAELGDYSSAREFFRRGTNVNKRHAPVWQAWGVLETRLGNAEDARKIFQEGIWACGQLTGNQSGGHNCARLWQAWGVLEAQCKDYGAARRCFSRALDANSRNVPAVTAWAQMEEELGNDRDARMIFERSLRKFAPGSNDKMTLWRCYELMEQRLGDLDASKNIYQRAMREALTIKDGDHEEIVESKSNKLRQNSAIPDINDVLMNKDVKKRKKDEFEVVRWEGGGGEVWMNDRAIESKIDLKNVKKQK